MIVPLLILTLTLLSCSSGTPKKPLNCSRLETLRQGTGGAQSQDRGDRFVEFDWELSKEINAEGKENIVISPISLKVVLAMLNEGARGKTAREIGEALGLNSTMARRMNSRERFSTILKSLQTSKGEYEIKIGTHLFIDKTASVKEDFHCKVQKYYNSDLEEVDFSDSAAAVKVINNWAKNVTEGHIEHLISEAEAHSSTILLLLNAVYFKGLWKQPFPENQTTMGAFHIGNKQTVNVPLMNTTDRFNYYDMTDLDAQLISLPYLGDKFAMYILLPNSRTGLNKLIQTLGPDRPLTEYIKNMTATTVNLILPKFEYHFTVSLRSALEKLNIKTMFTPSAELSDIADTRSGGLVVSNVLQKAGISVTEVGTVAYAATVAELMDKFGGEEEVVEFHADHPFLFFIEDLTTRTTVFVGKVANPEKGKAAAVDSTQADRPAADQCSGTKCSTGTDLPNRFGNDDRSKARFNFFDADLLKELGSQESGDFVVSPASIKSLLGLVLEAAENSTLYNLETLLRVPHNLTQSRELLNSLHQVLQKSRNSKVIVNTISHVFVSKTLSLNTTYSKAIKQYYDAEVSAEDFSMPAEAANNINDWISMKTRSLIPNLVDKEMISPDAYAFLVNAIYFNGKWKTEFPQQNTQEGCFYAAPDLQCQLVPMMAKSEELLYKYDMDFDSHILQIPYEDDRFSMLIVLPHKKDGMKDLTLDAARLTFPALLNKMNLYDVNLKMPRFIIDYSIELTDTLKKMGLEKLFGNDAQLPYMINNGQAKLSAVMHKAKIEVTEKGTKAAAAAGASVVPLMFGLETINIDIDHPFYYFIYEQESQSVLFAGRLSSPHGATEAHPALEPLNNSGMNKPSIRSPPNQQYLSKRPPVNTASYNGRDTTIHFPATERSRYRH